MRKAFGRHWSPLPFECSDCLLQIDSVPKGDRGDNQIEATSLILQIFAEPIANRTATIEKNRPSQRITRLAFVQTEMDAAPEFRVLNPFQCEQRSLDPAKFA
jgi:hypothetical protein